MSPSQLVRVFTKAYGKTPLAFLTMVRAEELARLLREELVDRGLTSVPTPKRQSKAPALSTIQKMLTNPYYKGQVSFQGAARI